MATTTTTTEEGRSWQSRLEDLRVKPELRALAGHLNLNQCKREGRSLRKADLVDSILEELLRRSREGIMSGTEVERLLSDKEASRDSSNGAGRAGTTAAATATGAAAAGAITRSGLSSQTTTTTSTRSRARTTRTTTTTVTTPSAPSVATRTVNTGGPRFMAESGTFEGLKIGGRKVAVLQLEVVKEPEKQGDHCFLRELFGERVQVVTTAVERTSEAVPTSVVISGITYELAARKSRKAERNFIGVPKLLVDLYYVAVSGPGLQPLCLKEEFEKLANFSAVQPLQKLAVRFELFLSRTHRTNCYTISRSEFLVHEDEPTDGDGTAMHDGCGWAPLSFLKGLQPRRRVPPSAVQVRLVSPVLGVFKGVLFASPTATKIELFPSMRKVPPSSREMSDKWRGNDGESLVAMVVLTESPSQTAKKMAKLLGGQKVPKEPCFSKTSPMVKMLLQALGVSDATVATFAKSAQNSDRESENHCKQAYLLGVGDPSGQLPPDTVFVTGLPPQALDPISMNSSDEANSGSDSTNSISSASLLAYPFVTRIPTTSTRDGRCWPMVRTKPQGMTEPIWKWFGELPFGFLIFSRTGEKCLPLQISKGDLDGDRYFVTWDPSIIQQLAPFRDPPVPPPPPPASVAMHEAAASGEPPQAPAEPSSSTAAVLANEVSPTTTTHHSPPPPPPPPPRRGGHTGNGHATATAASTTASPPLLTPPRPPSLRHRTATTAPLDAGAADPAVSSSAPAPLLPAASGDSVSTSSPSAAAAAAAAATRGNGGGTEEDWFSDLQMHLADIKLLYEILIIGQFYAAWKKRAKEASFDDGDAQELARLYGEALDRPKHGNLIVVALRLQKYLQRLPSEFLEQPLAGADEDGGQQELDGEDEQEEEDEEEEEEEAAEEEEAEEEEEDRLDEGERQ